MAESKATMSALDDSSDREISSTRIFDAPRDLVWEMWMKPQHITKWWGPRGFTTTTYEMDVRPGGLWHHVMHSPDGRDYLNKVIYVEVVKPERIVYDHVSYPAFRATITFEAQANKTRLHMCMVFETAELRDKCAKEHGAVEGLHQALDRLGELVSQRA